MSRGGGPGLHTLSPETTGMQSAAKWAAHSFQKRQNYEDSNKACGRQGLQGWNSSV